MTAGLLMSAHCRAMLATSFSRPSQGLGMVVGIPARALAIILKAPRPSLPLNMLDA